MFDSPQYLTNPIDIMFQASIVFNSSFICAGHSVSPRYFLSVNFVDFVSSHFWTNSISLGLLSRPQGASRVSSGQSEFLKNCNKEQIWRHMSPETQLHFYVLKYNQYNQFHWRGEDNSSILELNTNINLITVVGQDELVRKSSFLLFKKIFMIWGQMWSSESF